MWPVAVYLLPAQKLRHACFLLIGLPPMLRVGLVTLGYANAAFAFTPCRFDALAAGALVALTLRSASGVGLLRRWAGVSTLFSLSMVGALVLRIGTHSEHPLLRAFGVSILALLFASVLAAIVSSAPSSMIRRPFCLSPLRLVGKYSYAIYIFHQAIIIGLASMGISASTLERSFHTAIWGDLAFGALASGISLGTAMLSWWILEKRFLALKRFFSY